jgi:hypothetical protein
MHSSRLDPDLSSNDEPFDLTSPPDLEKARTVGESHMGRIGAGTQAPFGYTYPGALDGKPAVGDRSRDRRELLHRVWPRKRGTAAQQNGRQSRRYEAKAHGVIHELQQETRNTF